MDKVDEVIKILKDERKPTIKGDKVVVEVNHVFEQPVVNTRNMLKAWRDYNKNAEEFLEKKKEIRETLIIEAKKAHEEKLAEAKKFLEMNLDEVEVFKSSLYDAEVSKANNIINNSDKILEGAIKQLEAHHTKQCTDLKREIKKNEKGLEQFSSLGL